MSKIKHAFITKIKMNNNIKPIARRYQLTWRQLQLKKLTNLQIILAGGIVNNALRVINN